MLPSLMSLLFFLLPKVRPSHASSHPKISHSLLPRVAEIFSSDAGKTNSPIPTLSCYPQDQDPDQGILSAYCICNGTESLPQMTPTPPLGYQDLTSSCAYTTIPPCQTCTSLGFPENECMSIQDCNPLAASPMLFSSSSAASPLARGDNNIGNASLVAETSDGNLSLAHVITTAPSATSMAKFTSNSSLGQGDECLLQDAYCSLQGPGHSLDGLRNECLLWDNSCSGNRSLATSQFFGSVTSILMNNLCFYDSSSDCSKSNPPGRISVFNDVKNWMRSPQCMTENPMVIEMLDSDDANVIKEDLFLNETCCDGLSYCEVAADQVDVYYWSKPDANTSCQSIIGDGISDLAVGATTDGGDVYWGCTSWYSGSPLLVTTAVLTNVASMTFRSYLFNPWGESPCTNYSASLSSNLNPSIKPREIPPSLHPRGHTLIAPNGSVSTAVLGQVTFTSPSIYINFQGLHAGDDCGSTYISSTMIAFSSEELSTIAGHVERFASSQQFNPADLPCPPQSIMSQNWYIPLPGVPYRPFFAFPDKIRKEIPFFKYCDAFWFSVFDPPRALVPGLALTPEVTTNEPKAPSIAPMPSPVPDPGPKKTAANEDPPPSPAPAAHPQPMPQPKPTAVSPQQDPANSKPSPPANEDPVLPDSNAKQSAQSADPPQIPPKDADPAANAPADPPQTPPKDADPAAKTSADPPVQGAPPTTIQLRPQPNERPTTIFIGGKTDGDESSSGLGALIYNAFGRLDPTAKPEDASDPKASTADAVASFPTVTAAGQLLTISDPSAVSIAGTVLTPGGAAATIAGTPVSLAPSGNLVVGTGPSYQSSTVLTIAGHIVTANPTSFQIAGTPVKVGEPAVTVSGTAVSIGSSGDLIIGGSASTTSPLAAVFTVGAQEFTADEAGLVGSGTTVRVGGPAVLVAGTTVSLGPSGVLIVGSTTTTLAGFSPSSVFSVGGQTFTANPTDFLVAGTTLSAGGPGITIDSTPISLNPSGSLIIGTSTIPLQTPKPAIITTDGQVFTVEQGGAVAVDGVTLSSGGPGTVVSGTPISVGSGGFVIGSDTVRLPTVNGSTSSTVGIFTGAAPKSVESSRMVLWALLVFVMVI